MMSSVIRQLKVAQVQNEIEHLVWSNQFDLVAVSNIKGEVALYRLLLPKAWDLPPPKENYKVTALSWRPDGKVIAIGYSEGDVLLINVENKNILHTFKVHGEITCIQWLQEKTDSKKKVLLPEKEGKNYTEYVDFSQDFVLKPPNLNSYESTNNMDEANMHLLHKQKFFNLLLIGTSNGLLHISILGSLNSGTIDIKEKLNEDCSIIDVNMTELLDTAIVTVKNSENQVKIVFISTEIFKTHMKELFCLAIKNIELHTLLQYLNKAISSIIETWESILLEIDAKLSKYASKVPPGTLSTDFLELLMFGMCTDEMQEFLFNDMTKRGLEKFGQNIEMSYFNIQKLLLKNVTNVGQNLTFHLSELRGMSRFASRYASLGINEQNITDAISANGSFLIKSGEMQQIINNSMVYYKTFFRWLYAAIINLLDEQVPPEVPSMTQQDLAYIAEFLQLFDRIGSENNTTIRNNDKAGFIMERLGQYLADRDLSIVTTNEENIWTNLIAQNECILKHPAVIKHYPDMSLIQQMNFLQRAIDKIFVEPETVITQHMNVIQRLDVMPMNDNAVFTGFNTSSQSFMYAFPHPERKSIYFLDYIIADKICSARGALLHAYEEPGRAYSIIDVKFYTENILSVMFEDQHRQAVLMQCSLESICDQLQVVQTDRTLTSQQLVEIDVSDNGRIKSVGMSATSLAVSGMRSVSIVLGDNRKKVITYDMEGEEEDEDDADMTNSTLRESDADASMQDTSDLE